jgi:hypothetical protein
VLINIHQLLISKHNLLSHHRLHFMGCSTSRHAVAHSSDNTTVYHSCHFAKDIGDTKWASFLVDSVLLTKHKVADKTGCNCAQEQVGKEGDENNDIAKVSQSSSSLSSHQSRTSMTERIFCSDASFSMVIHRLDRMDTISQSGSKQQD